MRATDTGQRAQHRNQVIAGLADATRRRVLLALRETPHPLAEAALVRRLATDDATLPGPTGGSPELKRFHASLRHVHLPALSSAGLLDWDEAGNTVVLADDRLLEEPALWDVVTADAALDDVLSCLAEPARRAIVAALRRADGRVDRVRLAAQLCMHTGGANLTDDAVEQALAALRHEHLPALADCGLVCDEGERIVLTDDNRLAVLDPLFGIMFDSWVI